MMPGQKPEAINIAPTITDTHGRAWTVDLAALRTTLGVKAEDDAGVAQWVVEAPWAHPLWHSYLLALVHLRPMPDGRPTKLYLIGATHELWLYALNPEHPREPLIVGKNGARYLQPINFAAQNHRRERRGGRGSDRSGGQGGLRRHAVTRYGLYSSVGRTVR